MAFKEDALSDLRKAFERELRKEETTNAENEQKLLKEITVYLCSQKGISPIAGYKPEEIAAFLNKPAKEIQECMGGEWADMDSSKFENLVYTLYKKVQKSDKLTTW